jgi:hypothetical protein
MTRPINKTASAFLSVNQARSDCQSAICAITRADVIMWINEAIAQLESARAKIEAPSKDHGQRIRSTMHRVAESADAPRPQAPASGQPEHGGECAGSSPAPAPNAKGERHE